MYSWSSKAPLIISSLPDDSIQRRTLQNYIFARVKKGRKEVNPTDSFTISQIKDQEISEFNVFSERRATNYKAPRLWKGRSWRERRQFVITTDILIFCFAKYAPLFCRVSRSIVPITSISRKITFLRVPLFDIVSNTIYIGINHFLNLLMRKKPLELKHWWFGLVII